MTSEPFRSTAPFGVDLQDLVAELDDANQSPHLNAQKMVALSIADFHP